MAKQAIATRMARRLAPCDWQLPDPSPMTLKLLERAHACDVALDIRDARLPLTSANAELYEQLFAWKQHLVVLNKADLVDRKSMNEWKNYFERRNQRHVFVDAHNKNSVREMVMEIKSLLADEIKAHRTSLVLLTGLPNVGKSAISNTFHRVGRYNISALEKLTLSKVSPEPYTTKEIKSSKMNYYPPMYVLDTPSIMHRTIDDAEAGMKLALAGALDDEVVGVEKIAMYLLSLWNCQMTTAEHEFLVDAYRAHEFSKRPMDKFSAAEKRQMGQDDYKVEVKGILAESHLEFSGSVEKENEMGILIQTQLRELQDFFQTTTRKRMDLKRTAVKLLTLYRRGNLGRFTWDTVPDVTDGENEESSVLSFGQREAKPERKPRRVSRSTKSTSAESEPKKKKSKAEAFFSVKKKSNKMKPPIIWTKIQPLNPPTVGDPKTWKKRKPRFYIDFTKISWRPILDAAGIFRKKF